MRSAPVIRPAGENDARAVAEIYAPYVLDGVGPGDQLATVDR